MACHVLVGGLNNLDMCAAAQMISHAFWKSSNSGLVILSKDWTSKTQLPPLRLGPNGTKFTVLEPIEAQAAGRYTRYYRKKQSWIFVIQSKRYTQLQDREKRVFVAGEFNGWDKAIGSAKWELKPVSEKTGCNYELKVPLKRIPDEHLSQFKFVTEDGEWLDVPDSAPNLIQAEGINNFELNPAQSGKHIFRFELAEDYQPTGTEAIVWDVPEEAPEVHDLPHTQFLTSASTDLELGAIVEESSTTFRIFAPRAQGVKLCLSHKSDESDAVFHELDKVDSVTWELTLYQNLDGWYYTYRIEGQTIEGTSHFDGTFAVLDPYAKACLGHRGPGIIVAPERLKKVTKQFTAPSWHDLVIMEGHVRDFAAHAPIKLKAQERSGYTGLSKWLKAESSYIKEMGVNAVELQPIQEFDNRKPEDYHWGYMTVNYFSPESSYALKPKKASQIEEFRGLVQDFHDEDIAVILDVVYNHVGEPNHLLFVDKFYYFHLDDANDLMNWSGCGNDLRCDSPMGRRLIIDSLKHLVETYDVDGFRFDLAELIGIEVLREIETELKKIKPSLILIAEPWSFRGHIQDELRETGYASWNDGFRESIAKFVKGNGNQEMIQYFLAGSPGTSRFAAQTINYTESHDDHCWLDRITERAGHDGSDPTLLDRRRTHLMASVLFSSLGVPMLSAGQDFLRSKQGVSNTYQRGDLNALDYNKRYIYSGTHNYFREWIHFRRSELGSALRYDGGLKDGYMQFFFADGYSATVAVYNADGSVDAPKIVFAVNPHLEYANIECKGVETGKLLQIADQERFKVEGLEHARIPIDGNVFSLPPLTCGLWLVENA